MIKYFKAILALCISLSFSSIYADTIQINKEIEWQHYNSLIEIDNDNNYPFVSFIIQKNINNIDYYKYTECKYLPASSEEQSKYKSLKNINLQELNIKQYTVRKENVIEISLNPFRLNPTTGQLEKMHEFSVDIVTKKINKKTKSYTYPDNSLLSTGDWFKIRVDTTGIFKLTYEDLISIGISNPENIRVFGYGGKQLSYINEAEFYDDMHENPIFMSKGDDGIFNSGDYILFFGEHTTTWYYDEAYKMFMHNIHNYATHSLYYLTSSLGAGKRIETALAVSENENYTTDTTDTYFTHEKNLFNPIQSGRTWFGEKLERNSMYNFSFFSPNVIPNAISKFAVQFANQSSTASEIDIYINDNINDNINFRTGAVSYRWGYMYEKRLAFTTNNNTNSIGLKYTSSSYTSECYLGYVCMNTREWISLNNSPQLMFRDISTVAPGRITKFNIRNSSTNTIVWDITNATEPKIIQTETNGDITSFKYETSELKEFIAFNQSSYFKPFFYSNNKDRVANQNLHAINNIDYLIVTNPLFIDFANEIADLHRTKDGMNVLVTTPDLIYNEFSSGMPDVSAIRNFSKMLYNKSSNYKYLLLYGDGSFDNRQNVAGNSNMILTYQSKESLYELYSFTSDDYYGLLDEGEGENLGKIDIGIGRLPVRTKADARILNDKILSYSSGINTGNWNNNICFVGDDSDGNIHMAQPNEISEWLYNNKPTYNVNKIFFDAYPRITTPSGFRYPNVTEAINDAVKKGALIIDYVGHGNKRKLAHEEVLTETEVNSWKNYDKLSIFVTASCEVGRFDNYTITSLGESFILAPHGGGVAALTTTRVVYSGENHTLNTNFMHNALNPEYKLGDVLRLAKNNTSGDINKRNFTLLGDPAMKLAVPELKAKIEYINNYYITNDFSPVDTLNALSKAVVAGIITDRNDSKIGNTNGTINITIYDKRDSIVCYGHTDPAFSFKMQDKILYNGQASVKNGEFEFEFILPKDINFSQGTGKISLFAKTDKGIANGFTSGFSIGGISTTANEDDNGPGIKLYMNDTTFVNGGITNENPVLIAQLSDEYGINTTGNGIGHNITAVIDNDYSNPINLNSFYTGSLDKYNCGDINYPFYKLNAGEHTIEFKVWDIYNNSSTETINFMVAPEKTVKISNLRNAPNPFSDETYFMFDHNQPDGNKEITISVYNLMGEKVSEIKASDENNNFNISPIRWNGTDFKGNKLPRGMYIYIVVLQNPSGSIETQSAKTLIF